MNIITRGLGRFTKLLTRGYGRDKKDVYGGPSSKRTKDYTFEISVNVVKKGKKEFNIIIPIRKTRQKKFMIKSGVLKTLKKTIGIKSNINHKRLIDIIEAL